MQSFGFDPQVGRCVSVCPKFDFFIYLFVGDITQKGYEKKRTKLLASYINQAQSNDLDFFFFAPTHFHICLFSSALVFCVRFLCLCDETSVIYNFMHVSFQSILTSLFTERTYLPVLFISIFISTFSSTSTKRWTGSRSELCYRTEQCLVGFLLLTASACTTVTSQRWYQRRALSIR